MQLQKYTMFWEGSVQLFSHVHKMFLLTIFKKNNTKITSFPLLITPPAVFNITGSSDILGHWWEEMSRVKPAIKTAQL